MAGRPNILRPVKLTTNLPEDVFARLTLHLWSPAENRVPKGAYSKFLIDAINNALPKDQSNAPASNS
jgi:hypothetical protein